MTMGKGFIMSMSRKQKLNTRSSTEGELVGADDAAQMTLWTMHFMEAQHSPPRQQINHQTTGEWKEELLQEDQSY